MKECEELVDHPWPKFIDMLGVSQQKVSETGMPSAEDANGVDAERGAFDFLYGASGDDGDQQSYLSFAGGGETLSFTHEITMATTVDLSVDFDQTAGDARESGVSAGLAVAVVSVS
jgi:hypothetical protein